MIALGSSLSFELPFSDPDSGEQHSAQWNFGDGSALQPGSITFADGHGTVVGAHAYSQAGVYQARLTLSDSGGQTTETTIEVIVYDPSAGASSGAGAFNSPAGAWHGTGSLSGTTAFTFLVRYLPWQSAPAGAFVIHLGSRQTFIGTSLDWIVVDGARASFRGRGRLSSGGSYSYQVTGIDADLLGLSRADRIRVRIWSSNDQGQEVVLYDNQVDPATTGTNEEGTRLGTGIIHLARR